MTGSSSRGGRWGQPQQQCFFLSSITLRHHDSKLHSRQHPLKINKNVCTTPFRTRSSFSWRPEEPFTRIYFIVSVSPCRILSVVGAYGLDFQETKQDTWILKINIDAKAEMLHRSKSMPNFNPSKKSSYPVFAIFVLCQHPHHVSCFVSWELVQNFPSGPTWALYHFCHLPNNEMFFTWGNAMGIVRAAFETVHFSRMFMLCSPWHATSNMYV